MGKKTPQIGLELGTARSVGQCLTYRATGAPLLKEKGGKVYNSLTS